MPASEEPPGDRPTRWIGSSPVPENDRERDRRRRFLDQTIDLPVVEQPQVQYVPVPVPVPYPAAGYPPGHPPAAYPPLPYPPRPRRRAWPWVLLMVAILCVGCCGGCAVWVQPFLQQYPSSASPAATITGLTRLDDPALVAEAHRLRQASLESEQLGEQRFAIIYADATNRQRRVILFGATRFIGDSGKDLDTAFDRLGSSLALTGRREVDPGALRGEQRCATGQFRGVPVSVCGWADHGSIGLAIFTGRDVDAGAVLLHTLRSAVIQRHN